ncbi:sugar kinase [Proteus vulgaris]|uniref:sugar kinase n=1 Tax=Proteus vulgaris TaxID=585 RepID=UPI0018E3FD64|nr:sugar kinase [Proteus vulgaris]MBI6529248.1 sugar kinase [Proteus vulgaris]
MKRIAFIGECMIELNGSPFGEMIQTFGGDVLNSALYLSRALSHKQDNQLEVFFISAMGHDLLSKEMRYRWQKENINCQWVLEDKKHHAGIYLIQTDANGERTFLYWRNNSAACHLFQHPDYPRLEKALDEFDVIYLSGITLAIFNHEDKTKLLHLIAHLSKLGKEIIFDSNYRSHLWDNSLTAKYWYHQLLPFVTLALVTDDDEKKLWNDITINNTFQRLHHAGVKKVVIKSGKEGCYCSGFQPDILKIPATNVEHIVDTTSAGDAFNAGFLAGYLNHLTILQSAEMGHLLAGRVIQHKGAIIPQEDTQPITTTFFKNEK